ncbi:hypothetical protein Tco_0705999 [Tanacetum coccineum]|uniref:Uncharacterized protein n=1 Tax=Tanacetum coccineum TaxID=301880 RepID=A0ABQ4Y882_9ASTR
MAESAKRHEENSNILKEIQASTIAAIRNQGASIKTLEIQIDQMSKVLQERGIRDQYAVSIKEDTAYPCLHSPKTTEDEAQYAISRDTQYAVFNIWNEYNILEDIIVGCLSSLVVLPFIKRILPNTSYLILQGYRRYQKDDFRALLE